MSNQTIIKAMRAIKSRGVFRAVSAFDSHCPHVDWPTWNAICHYCKENRVDLFVFGGDNLDCSAISHHTKGKPIYRAQGQMQKDLDMFESRMLSVIEDILPRACERVWMKGNHEDWLEQMLEEQPELTGLVDFVKYLELSRRGWNVIEQGDHFIKGKLKWIHGDVLSGANAVQKALNTYVENIQFGHFHTSAHATKILPHTKTEKWQAYSCPCVGRLDASYLKKRPTGWMNGFAITEFYDNGMFNNYLVNVFKGRFSYGGRIYGR